MDKTMFHLHKAELWDEARLLSVSLPWIMESVRVVGIRSFLDDAKAYVMSCKPLCTTNDAIIEEIKLVHGALALSTDALVGDDGYQQVPAQLIGRLGRFNKSTFNVIGPLAHACKSWCDENMLLQPLESSTPLAVPGEALEHAFQDHIGSITCVKMLADGRLVSGSGDKTLRIWNIASGTCDRVLVCRSGAMQSSKIIADGWMVGVVGRCVYLIRIRSQLTNTTGTSSSDAPYPIGNWDDKCCYIQCSDAPISVIQYSQGMIVIGNNDGFFTFLKVNERKLTGP